MAGNVHSYVFVHYLKFYAFYLMIKQLKHCRSSKHHTDFLPNLVRRGGILLFISSAIKTTLFTL